MPVHDIEVELPARVISHKDLTISVWSDKEKLGELRVSKGTVDWVPGKAQTTYYLSWERFDEMMREHGRRRRRGPE
jgi:hypothetical protein